MFLTCARWAWSSRHFEPRPWLCGYPTHDTYLQLPLLSSSRHLSEFTGSRYRMKPGGHTGISQRHQPLLGLLSLSWSCLLDPYNSEPVRLTAMAPFTVSGPTPLFFSLHWQKFELFCLSEPRGGSSTSQLFEKDSVTFHNWQVKWYRFVVYNMFWNRHTPWMAK